jgi:hypothetical protein
VLLRNTPVAAALNAMSYRCCVCSTVFSEEKAICEDWNDPMKSLGCPNCKTFLKLDPAENVEPYISRYMFQVSMLLILGAVLCVTSLFTNNKQILIYVAGAVCVSVSVIVIYQATQKSLQGFKTVKVGK